MVFVIVLKDKLLIVTVRPSSFHLSFTSLNVSFFRENLKLKVTCQDTLVIIIFRTGDPKQQSSKYLSTKFGQQK